MGPDALVDAVIALRRAKDADEIAEILSVPIGTVRSSYREQAGTPIQPAYGEVEAEIRIEEPFRAALEAVWCEATDEMDLSITEREGLGFEHI